MAAPAFGAGGPTSDLRWISRSRSIRLELDLVELAVFAVGIPQGPLPLIPAAENRDLDRLPVIA
jgi:hypothetical protein